jgi:ParB family transcriptional regulator, chromosome partitioning protein
MSEEIQQIPAHLVVPGRYQPRHRFDERTLAELAESIRQHGIIQPVVVRAVGSRYELIAGERRFRAAQKLGMTEIPAIVRPYSEEQALEASLIENLQREDISVVETARAFQRLADEFRYSQGEIAHRTGKSRAAVGNTLRLLQLPDDVLEMLDRGDLMEGHARALLALPYPSLQSEVAVWISENAVSVREAEGKIRSLNKGPSAKPSPARNGKSRSNDPSVADLEDRLRRHFGTKVSIASTRGRGALTLEFYGLDDLDRILELMGLSAE